MTAARLFAVALLLSAGTAAAQDERQTPAVALQAESAAKPPAPPSLDELQWIARPIVIFADSPNDPRYLQQLRMLDERMPELEDRAVIVLTDTDRAANGPLRQQLRPRDFNLVLIDLDGTIAQRRPAPTTARELINMIDRMPSRRQETGSRRQ
jgi:hypothetical protein